jgi:hypothetical protein
MPVIQHTQHSMIFENKLKQMAWAHSEMQPAHLHSACGGVTWLRQHTARASCATRIDLPVARLHPNLNVRLGHF